MKELFCGVALSILSLLSACGEATNSVPAPGSSGGAGNLPHAEAWKLPHGYTQPSLKTGTKLDTYGTCSADGPDCPAHTQCAVVFLDTGTVGPSCVAANICDLLTCGGDSCVVLDSYPAQVTCGK